MKPAPPSSMTRIQSDQTADQHIDELNERWGEIFRREYMAKLSFLARCPLAGHPYQHPEYRGVNRILLKGCQHYIYYRYDPTKQQITIIALWSNRRGGDPPL